MAYEVNGLGELELNVRMLQRKGSLLMPENLKTSDVQFSSLKNVGKLIISHDGYFHYVRSFVFIRLRISATFFFKIAFQQLLAAI